MIELKETTTYKTFIIAVSLVVVLSLSGIFMGISINTRHLIYEEILAQARAHFYSIVITRKWNANYGGVYVEKKTGIESNPYIEDTDIKSIDGKTYTLKNPAMMTREISEYSQKGKKLQFHITSLNFINPANKPDEFEREALKSFDKGKQEAYNKENRDDRTFFRYIAPLYIEEECMKCHAKHGYKVGDVRGGISISFDIEDIENKLESNIIVITLLGLVCITILLVIIYFFTLKLMKRISEARERIETMAITDELTGLFNRRHVMVRFAEEFARSKRVGGDLCCIMVDIDNFKVINDEYGHLAGDEILREVSKLIKNTTRKYDIVGRYGGEEFLIVLPDTNLENAGNLAERMRMNVKENWNEKRGLTVVKSVTISLGVTYMIGKDATIDDILKRADESLYQAKASGKDTVVWN